MAKVLMALLIVIALEATIAIGFAVYIFISDDMEFRRICKRKESE